MRTLLNLVKEYSSLNTLLENIKANIEQDRPCGFYLGGGEGRAQLDNKNGSLDKVFSFLKEELQQLYDEIQSRTPTEEIEFLE